MDIKQLVAGAKGKPMNEGMDTNGKMLAMMTQMRAMMDEIIGMMESGGKQAGFESVDKGM